MRNVIWNLAFLKIYIYIFLCITLIFNTDFEFISAIFETPHDTLNGLIFACIHFPLD